MLSDLHLSFLGYFLWFPTFHYHVYNSLDLDTWLPPLPRYLKIFFYPKAMHGSKIFISFAFFKPGDFKHIIHTSYMSFWHNVHFCIVFCCIQEKRASQEQKRNSGLLWMNTGIMNSIPSVFSWEYRKHFLITFWALRMYISRHTYNHSKIVTLIVFVVMALRVGEKIYIYTRQLHACIYTRTHSEYSI